MKWFLILTMPSGTQFVVSIVNDSLALFPISKDKETVLKQIMCFDSEEKAQDWINKTASLSEKGADLMSRVKPVSADELQLQ